MSIPNFSHKQNKTNNNISNNTTNTLNHQDQSFDYLEWIPQSIVLLKTTFSSLLAKLQKKKISFVIDGLFHNGVTVGFLSFSHLLFAV